MKLLFFLYSVDVTKMNRVTVSIIVAIICLISSTYGDYEGDEDVVSRQRRETSNNSHELTIGTVFLILVFLAAALILRYIIIDCVHRCCRMICDDGSTTHITIIQPPADYPVVNNGQNNFGFAQPSQPEMHQDLPPPYYPSAEHTKQVQVSDIKSGPTNPK